ncbi:MAG TPA: hypothetical protein H9986_05525 [Candidatus Prevotella stercoripullorum]|nr:hypothetical protein [Candidatus Prevotella stercoripullorum]
METTEDDSRKAEELANELHALVNRLGQTGRYDLMLRAISVPVLEQLRIEAARAKLSRLVITRDFRFILPDYNAEVTLTPVHKALYILFLNHEEGIEFKDLSDHREELRRIYRSISPSTDPDRIDETVSRLTDPTDNAVNEKCSRIKAAFGSLMDEYTLSYYMISSHTTRHFNSSSRVWFKRLKLITLPRQLVIGEYEDSGKP